MAVRFQGMSVKQAASHFGVRRSGISAALRRAERILGEADGQR